MRRLSLFLLVVAAFFAVVASGIEVNGMKQPVAVASGSFYVHPDSSTSAAYLATSYTVYAQDQTDDVYVKCYRAGVADAVELLVPAGKSLLVPAPAPEYDASTGYWRHRFAVTAVADTVYFIPWVR
jgi:hypothetical protein